MKKILTATATFLLATTVFAQEMNTGYFLDNYVFSHQINPAMQPSGNGHFGLLVDNITLTDNSNLGLQNFIFPVGDELVHGFNNKVSPDMMLSLLPDVMSMRAGINENLLSIGTRNKRSYTTFEINLKGLGNIDLPKSTFEFFKRGYDQNHYDFAGMHLYANSYLEAALNFSFPLTSNFYVGLGIKGLVGLASAQLDFTRADMTINQRGEVNIETSAYGNLNVPGVTELVYDNQHENMKPKFGALSNSADIYDMLPSGYGAAIDLGFHWRLGFIEADAAILNLGAIKWTNQVGASYNKTIEMTSYDSSIGRAIDLLAIYATYEIEGESLQVLPVTANAGLKCHLGSKLSAGVLASYQYGPVSYYESRVGLNITPLSLISIAASAGMSNYGPVYGAAVNLKLQALNLYAGVDGIPTLYTPQYVPLSTVNTVVKAGLVLTFGNNK